MEHSVFVLYEIQPSAYFSFATARTQYAGLAETLHSIMMVLDGGFDMSVLILPAE